MSRDEPRMTYIRHSSPPFHCWNWCQYFFLPHVYQLSIPQVREAMNDHWIPYIISIRNDSFINACYRAGCGYPFLWSWRLVGEKALGSGTQSHPQLHSKLGTVPRYTGPCLKINKIKQRLLKKRPASGFFENGILRWFLFFIFFFGPGWKIDGEPDFKELMIGLFDKLGIDRLCRNRSVVQECPLWLCPCVCWGIISV